MSEPLDSENHIVIHQRPDAAPEGSIRHPRDVTHRANTQKALRSLTRELLLEKENLENVLATMKDGVFIIDANYAIQYGNPALEKDFGTWKGRLCYEYFHDRAAPCPWCSCHDVLKGEMARQQWRFQKIDKYFDVVDAPLKSPDGNVHTLRIMRDITEHRSLEREVLNASDRERRQIGQNLHDGLLQHLSGVAAMCEILARKLTAQKNEEEPLAAKIAALLETAVDQARGIAKGLYPVDLEKHGLTRALETLASTTEALFDVSCSLRCPSPISVEDIDMGTHLYRIAQEAITNAVKHGGARNIVVRLKKSGKTVTLIVEDDGAGMPESFSSRTVSDFFQERDGMGLRTMKYRADMIGATLEIRSRPQKGAQVRCSFRPALQSAPKQPGKQGA
jgi:signal transduction histidine kinase